MKNRGKRIPPEKSAGKSRPGTRLRAEAPHFGLPASENAPGQAGVQARYRFPFETIGSKQNRRYKAQQLAYDAMEAHSLDTALKLARRAVALDSACLDALTLIAQAESSSPKDKIQRMEQIVRVGERDLGKKFFQQNAGHFWAILETRPYMRARTYLAQMLADAGRVDEAMRHYDEMLTLNPNDNQGLRYPLIGHYLAAGRLDRVRDLFKEFEDEGSAMFAWALVLERFLSDDHPGAAKALTEAQEANKFVEPYLAGQRKISKHLPEMYGWGDENEAIVCADAIGTAWARHPEAVAWLSTQMTTQSTKNQTTVKRVGRNDPCPCGSGKKYKKCHGM